MQTWHCCMSYKHAHNGRVQVHATIGTHNHRYIKQSRAPWHCWKGQRLASLEQQQPEVMKTARHNACRRPACNTCCPSNACALAQERSTHTSGCVLLPCSVTACAYSSQRSTHQSASRNCRKEMIRKQQLHGHRVNGQALVNTVNATLSQHPAAAKSLSQQQRQHGKFSGFLSY